MIHKQLFNDSIKQQLKRNEDNSYFFSNRPRTSMSRAMLLIFNISIRFSLNSLHQNFGSGVFFQLSQLQYLLLREKY